ncbi:MAG: hypothetical protein A2X64_08330 [Ignavibacteria bacterium GWF2_33_9]|nr:MAG: hypothetical protein A2X64_08330 [Ignavibacteria bacterium GWF2_33_9]
MTQKIISFKNLALFGLILISLGVNFFIIFTDSMRTLGIIFLAIGGLMIVISILRRKMQEKEESKK